MELAVEDSSFMAALELGHAGQPLAPALAGCVDRARTGLADERSALLTSTPRRG